MQLSVDIGSHLISCSNYPAPTTMGQVFDILNAADVISSECAEQMKKAVGFRNLAVHNYETINWAIVHAIATRHLDDFKQFAKAVDELTQ